MNSLTEKQKQDFINALNKNDDVSINKMIEDGSIYKNDAFFLTDMPMSFFEETQKIEVLCSGKKVDMWKGYYDNSFDELWYDEEDIDITSINIKNTAAVINIKTIFVLLNKKDLLKNIDGQADDKYKEEEINKKINFWSQFLVFQNVENAMPLFDVLKFFNNCKSTQFLNFDKDNFSTLISDYSSKYILNKKKIFVDNAKNLLILTVLSRIKNNNILDKKNLYKDNISKTAFSNSFLKLLEKHEDKFLINLFSDQDRDKNFFLMKKVISEMTDKSFFKVSDLWNMVVENSSNNQFPLEYLIFKNSTKPDKNAFLLEIMKNKSSFDRLRKFISHNGLGQDALLNINQFDFLYKMDINIDCISLKEDCINISKTKDRAKINKALKLLLHIDKKDNQLFDKINENNEVIKGFINNPAVSKQKEIKAFLESKVLKDNLDTSGLKKNKKNIL